MGIIQKQSIQSSIIIFIGFAIGGINVVFIQPKILTQEQFGLTQLISGSGVILASLCTFGSLPVIYKFFPFYKSYLSPRKNDLPFITLVTCLVGFLIFGIIGYSCRNIIIRKYSANSPLFVEYYYLVFIFGFIMLMMNWLESFSWSFRKGVISNGLKETAPRLFFTILLSCIGLHIITQPGIIYFLYSISFLLPAIILFFVLRNTKEFYFNTIISPVTRRLKGKMVNFGLFIFAGQFLELLSRTIDTLIIPAKSGGLASVAVLSMATFLVTLLDIPARSMNAISIPVLAESWKNKDMKNINHVYKKSVTNLLIIGSFIFCLLLINCNNLALYLGKGYHNILPVVFILGLSKLIDLGTGANTQIIGTSSFWRVNFFTTVALTIVAIPLNYLLISAYGVMGAAYASIISISFYNTIRFLFLWIQFRLQPYNFKHLLTLAIATLCASVAYFVPHYFSIIPDSILRTCVFLLLFIPAVYFTKLSEEINDMIVKYLFWIKKKK